jgi:hypothetical protein
LKTLGLDFHKPVNFSSPPLSIFRRDCKPYKHWNASSIAPSI